MKLGLDTRERADEESEPISVRVAERVARIFQVFLGLGLALVVLGSAITIAGTGGLPEETIPATELPGRLLEGNGDAMLTLGILVFLAGPVLGVLALAVGTLRQGDRRTGLLAMLVLVIVASAPFVRVVGGR